MSGTADPVLIAARDDILLPFLIEPHGLRGRIVRLGPVVDEIVQRHDYPEPVAKLLAETLALAVCLSGALKFEGVFTLQAKGNGAVKTLMADVTAAGVVRGYAGYDEEELAEALSAEGEEVPMQHLLAGGYLAFTVDQGEDTERYQGIVELSGSTLAECTHAYFRQSEQLQTGIKLATGKDRNGAWRAGALMIQRMPFEGGAGHGPPVTEEEFEDAWRTSMALMGSSESAELLDRNLSSERLLYRLFHESGIRVFDPQPIQVGCRCSPERVELVLRSLTLEEIADLSIDGVVSVTCEFCKTERRYDQPALDQLRARRDNPAA